MSAFSLQEFYQRNRRVVIWVILFALLYLLRDFFGVVFLTFVIAIIATPLADVGVRRLHMPHWLALSLVYVMFLLILASFVRFVVPSVASEVNRLIENLPTTEMRLIEAKNRFVDAYPSLRQPVSGFLRSALSEEVLASVDRRLANERARLGLREGEVEEALDEGLQLTPRQEEYWNRQDQLYFNALMNEQFQLVRRYAPTVINMLYRATATT